jgi:ferredoxin-NADP reductase
VRDVAVGTNLTIGLPAGEFVIDETPGRRLFITAGSGITPVMSMLRHLVSRGELRGVVHLHYARSEEDVIFGGELRAMAVDHPGYRLAIVHTHTDPRRFSTERLDELVPDWRSRPAWACGPQGLLASVTDTFERAGRADALHLERVAPVLAPQPLADGEATVRFTTTATESRAARRTPLLRVAEDAGIAAPHGCRMGICHTCDTTLVSGCVTDLRTGDRIDQPGARIQVCVCAAESDVELAL